MTVPVYPAGITDAKVERVEKDVQALRASAITREEHQNTVASLLQTIQALEGRLKKLEERQGDRQGDSNSR
jgi:hypothetical protein